MKPPHRSLARIALALLCVIQSATAATQGDTSNASQSSARDLGWPREVTRNGVRLVYYQPQVDEWNDFRKLKARLAIVLTPKNGKPAVGVEEVETNTDANLQQRTVLIDNIKITSVRFPSLSGAEEAEMQDLLRTTFPGRPLTLSLDRLIACVQAGGHVVTPYGSTGVVKGPDNLYAGHDGNVYKRDDNGNWSKWENGGWQPFNPSKPQGTLSSQNRQNLSSEAQNQGNLGGTNQTPGSRQANANNTNKGTGGNRNETGLATDEKTSRQSNLQQSDNSRRQDRSSENSSRQGGSNDLTRGLDREASARQRGSQNVNLQQRYQQREGRRSTAGERSRRAGGERNRRREQ
jgi:hypothetical protein